MLANGGRRGGASTLSSSRSVIHQGFVGKLDVKGRGAEGYSVFRFPRLQLFLGPPPFQGALRNGHTGGWRACVLTNIESARVCFTERFTSARLQCVTISLTFGASSPRIGVRNPGILASVRSGIRFPRPIFGLQGSQVTHDSCWVYVVDSCH